MADCKEQFLMWPLWKTRNRYWMDVLIVCDQWGGRYSRENKWPDMAAVINQQCLSNKRLKAWWPQHEGSTCLRESSMKEVDVQENQFGKCTPTMRLTHLVEKDSWFLSLVRNHHTIIFNLCPRILSQALCSEAPPKKDFMTRSLLWGRVDIVIG